MNIHGLQKLTLVDFPGKTAAIIFSGSCNFRCPFCHNAALVLDPLSQPFYPEDEVLDFLKKRKSMLEGVVFTGGEPMLQKDLLEFAKKVQDLGYFIKLDTNGSFPDKLEKMIDLKLVDYVAMDIKNSLDRYAATIGLESFDTSPIKRSIELLKEDRCDYEFRTTVVKELHDKKSFDDIGKLITSCSRYFLQSFVPSQDTISQHLTPPSMEELESYKICLKTYITNVSIRDR